MFRLARILTPRTSTSRFSLFRVPTALAVALAAVVAISMTMRMSAAQAPEAMGGGNSGNRQDGAAQSQRDEIDTERQRREIAKEIETLSAHAWAGEYYEGDGLGANIRMSLAPRTGVAATWHGCLGLYGANHGQVIAGSDGLLHLAYALEKRSGFGGFPERVRPVRWGARRYLIPDEKMMAFVNAIHHGFEPRAQIHGMFLLAEGDEHKAAEGLPDLPSPYRESLRREPVEAGVIAVAREAVRTNQDKSCDFTYRITLNRGSADGLSAGIELKRIQPDHGWHTATIDRVARHQSSATMGFILEDCAKPTSVPAVGWRFSTGAYRPGSRTAARH